MRRRAGADRTVTGLAIGWLLVLPCVCPAAPPAEPPVGIDGSGPDLANALIGNISIRTGDVFDPGDPSESGALYQVANTLHVETKDDVIRRQLLIHSGDAYSPQSLKEAERILRENDYLSSAKISPTRYEDGFVDLEVVTVDAWSLTPSISFSRKGGHNSGGVEIEESNLLGTGTELKVGYRSGAVRDEHYLAYRDRQLGESWLQLDFGVASNSDGSAEHFLLQQPFYALDTKRSFGVAFHQFDELDPIYRLGEVESETRHETLTTELFYGWSDGLRDGWVRRWRAGLAYDEHRFTPDPLSTAPGEPVDRRDVYPFIGVEWLEDWYETTRNADHMAIVEDRHLGARISARLGYATSALGGEEEAWLLTAKASRGFRPTPKDTLMLFAGLDSRFAANNDDTYQLAAGARYYRRQSDKRLFVGELLADAGRRFDTDRIPMLGGDTGLRGYPIGYQSGDRRILLTLEQRVFTDWYPFRIFRVGGAAFFDAGRVWGGTDGTDLGLLRNVGVGLRISSPRSSTGRMLHVNLAWPLDGPEDIRGAQLMIETRKSF